MHIVIFWSYWMFKFMELNCKLKGNNGVGFFYFNGTQELMAEYSRILIQTPWILSQVHWHLDGAYHVHIASLPKWIIMVTNSFKIPYSIIDLQMNRNFWTCLDNQGYYSFKDLNSCTFEYRFLHVWKLLNINFNRNFNENWRMKNMVS